MCWPLFKAQSSAWALRSSRGKTDKLKGKGCTLVEEGSAPERTEGREGA